MAKIIGNTTATPTPRSDWNQTNPAKADYIKNKPTILTEEDVVELIVENGGGNGDVTINQVQSDWNQTDDTKMDYIKNKPEILTEEYILGLIGENGGSTGKNTVFIEFKYNDSNVYVLVNSSYDEVTELINNQQPVVLFRKQGSQTYYYTYIGSSWTSTTSHRFVCVNGKSETIVSVRSDGVVGHSSYELAQKSDLDNYATKDYVDNAINGTLNALETLIDESGVLE